MIPNYGEAFKFSIGLVDRSSRPQFKASPTIAAGDFKVSTDGGSLTNLATLPDIYPAGGKAVRIQLSASEMSGGIVTVIGSDAAGNEWDDVIISITPDPLRAELTSVPAAASSTDDRIAWLFMLARNLRKQDFNRETVYADNGMTAIGSSAKSDSGGIFSRGEYQ